MTLVSLIDSTTTLCRATALPSTHVDSIAALEGQLARLLARSRRQGASMAVLWIEVDLLAPPEPAPEVDSHQAVVRALDARLCNRVRETDRVFQVGDTGFAVLLVADEPGARLVESRLQEQLRGCYGMEGWLARVHVDTGLAVSAEDHRQGGRLLQAAIDNLRARRPPAVANGA